jgi:dihydrofolate synthase / folylpolyglutamate synthase
LQQGFPRRRMILIFGVLNDKDYPAMVRRLFPLADRVILTRPHSERALPLDVLLPVARRFHEDIELCTNPGDALLSALSWAGKEDLVCVAGSLYLVGEIKKIYQAGGRADRIPEERAR